VYLVLEFCTVMQINDLVLNVYTHTYARNAHCDAQNAASHMNISVLTQTHLNSVLLQITMDI
jgi:hypothetical protein